MKSYKTYGEFTASNPELLEVDPALTEECVKFISARYESDAQIIEVGSGTGRILSPVVRAFPHARGVEIDKVLADYCVNKHPELVASVDVSDYCEMARVPGTLDVVLVLQNTAFGFAEIHALQKLFSAACQDLCDDGELIVESSTAEVLQSVADTALRITFIDDQKVILGSIYHDKNSRLLVRHSLVLSEDREWMQYFESVTAWMPDDILSIATKTGFVPVLHIDNWRQEKQASPSCNSIYVFKKQ